LDISEKLNRWTLSSTFRGKYDHWQTCSASSILFLGPTFPEILPGLCTLFHIYAVCFSLIILIFSVFKSAKQRKYFTAILFRILLFTFSTYFRFHSYLVFSSTQSFSANQKRWFRIFCTVISTFLHGDFTFLHSDLGKITKKPTNQNRGFLIGNCHGGYHEYNLLRGQMLINMAPFCFLEIRGCAIGEKLISWIANWHGDIAILTPVKI